MNDDDPVVQQVPFRTATVLPAASGCAECGIEHPAELPHDVTTLQYQYWFRSAEARAGRAERWPTWRDAMAHCTPNMQAQWTGALYVMGIVDIDSEFVRPTQDREDDDETKEHENG